MSIEYLFDHLVIIGRDSLSQLSDLFAKLGFQLTPPSRHNLGSSNRLIMFYSSYIELLGWEKGQLPQRAEIANQAMGLDALVFRTDNAEETYKRLQALGFAVNPVQDLSRESVHLGKTVLVKFKTVRFSEQPIAGLRVYFCEHITPQYVWQEQWIKHENQLEHLTQITIASSNIFDTLNTLQKLLNLSPSNFSITPEVIQIMLPNIQIQIRADQSAANATIQEAKISKNPSSNIDLILNPQLFKQL